MFTYNYDMGVFQCSFTAGQVEAMVWAVDHACDFFHSQAFITLCSAMSAEVRFSAIRNALDTLQLHLHTIMGKYPELLH